MKSLGEHSKALEESTGSQGERNWETIMALEKEHAQAIQSLKFVSLRVFVQQSTNSLFWGFPVGSVVKNPYMGDMGLSPDPGRPYIMRSN